MTKQILIVGAGITIFSVATVSVLVILEVIEFSTLWGSVGRLTSIIAVVIAASVLIAGLAKLARKG